MMNKIKLAIIGIDQKGISVYNLLKNLDDIEIACFINMEGSIPSLNGIMGKNVKIYNNLKKLLEIEGLNIVINTVKSNAVDDVLKSIRGSVSIIETRAANLMVHLFREKQELLKIKRVQGELSTILSSVQEAVEVLAVAHIPRRLTVVPISPSTAMRRMLEQFQRLP